ncbi:hypothetical protein MP228_005517 [Amoeboaphelidium protococcarum]|nr:hypothetical protein MP228_005517 [Amoeboaphelidium protococcarum]
MMSNFEKAKALLESTYEICETLGTGAFSEVKKAIHKKTGEQYAIKIIDRSKCVGKENMIQSEINILKKVKHDNIIQLFDLFETENKIYLVMELVTGGELFDSIVACGHYTEADAAGIIQTIMLAIDYLHSAGIAHRDLKPENLLFYSRDKGSKIMISDFGLSKIFSDEEMMKTACGTPGYVSPEVLRRQGYGKEVDLWSIGVIAYILLCGYPPFYSENNQELFQQILRGEYEFDSPHWDDISDEAKDFVSKLLVVDPRKRYNAQQALDHPFLVNNCVGDQSRFQPLEDPESEIFDVETLHQMLKPLEITVPLMPGEEVPNLPPSRPPSAKNLAKRVSENLRSRGLSQSRRRSVDIKGVRSNMTGQHAAPPMPMANGTDQNHSRRKSQQYADRLAQDPNNVHLKSVIREVEESGSKSSLGRQSSGMTDPSIQAQN